MSAIAGKSAARRRYSILAGGLICGLMSVPTPTVTGPPATAAVVAAPSPQVATLQQQPAKPQPQHHWYQLGRASWYGSEFQGQPTASGEAYNMYQMTCAHRSLPLGALVRVTNLRNRRSVLVRVNDRGPVARNRVVDLSYAAAKSLHFHGLAPVRLELVDARPSAQELAQLNWPAQTLPPSPRH